MSVLQISGIVLFWFFLGALGVRGFQRALLGVRYRSQLAIDSSMSVAGYAASSRRSGFRLWLVGAGYEARHAVTYFVILESLFVVFGFMMVFFIFQSGWLPWVEAGLLSIPGNIGELFVPLFYIAPYLVAVMLASIPFVVVAGKRKRREEQTEEELPIFLEYLVTLSEAGLGFDEALGKVLEVRKKSSLLGGVFEKFRKEVLAGTSRVDAYWRIRERLQTHPVKTFTSALIQAENAGGSIANILRQQGTEALERRRMKALEIAHTLPVRLLFPMMCCFLPGLLSVLLGPLLFRMIEAVESITRSIGS